MKIDIKEVRKRVGQSIARQRMSCDLTQEQVAERLGIGNEAVSRIERGIVEPSVVRMIQLAEIFNCPVASFFEESSQRMDDLMGGLAKQLAQLEEKDRAFVIRMAKETTAHFLQEES